MELARSTSRGGYFVRSIFAFALTVIATVLLLVAVASPVARAADEPKADWKGASIVYDGHQYYAAPEPAKAGESHGLPVGTKYYVYIEETDNGPNGGKVLLQKAHVIYFAPSADPPKETSATYVAYDYSATKVYSNPQSSKAIAVTPQGESDQVASSCSVEGIGWIICPVTVFLANSMDWLFDVLAGLIAVQPPVTGDANSDLYVAWNVMRSIANIAFIIAFLIIIYSQLTNLGLTNYGLKKLIPRLIIAAIAVNLSFYICAIALDISNIAGYSLQDILVKIRQDTFNIDNDTWSAANNSWGTLATFILSAGTAATIGAIAIAGDPVGPLFFLLPLLVGLALTVLFVLLVLAARQAIIIILIVISPLAFVAYLLPNTEKWFEKWRELFTTMLIFFPAFSLVFGGSQLAGGLIVQNATNVIMMIFGMAVQVAPLVITPLLLRLSGSLLGRIAGIINDPRKGLLDRSRNWAKERYDVRRRESLGKTTGAARFNPFRRAAQLMDNDKQALKERSENADQRSTNRYLATTRHKSLQRASVLANERKEAIETRLNSDNALVRNVRGSELNLSALELEAEKAELDLQQADTDAMLKEFRAGKYKAVGNPRIKELRQDMARRLILTSAQRQRAATADLEQQKIISEGMSRNAYGSLTVATGIGGASARTRAESAAANALLKLENQAVEDTVNLISATAERNGSNLKIDATKIYNDALAGIGDHSAIQIEAALEALAKDGQVAMLESARGSTAIDQTALGRVLARNAGTMKAKGGFHLQADPSLNIENFIRAAGGNEEDGARAFREAMDMARLASLGDTTTENISELKSGWLDSMVSLLTGPDSDSFIARALADPSGNGEKALRAAQENFSLALQDPQFLGKIGDRKDQVIAISERLKGAPIPPRPTADPETPREELPPTDDSGFQS